MNFKLHLLETITNNFSDDKKVGSGRYGNVYKGLYNGKEIAVKKIHHLLRIDDGAFFDSKFRNITMINHKNIVPLLGYCYELRKNYVQHNGELVMATIRERILCFDYIEGGSLDRHIGDNYCGLDWHTCYQIIKGTCEGLNHLHGAHEPIFHLDLKPSNILLDKNWMAKISDLGLSRLIASETDVPVKGTIGYMPPEYIDGGHISKRYDVFSLGVIILKIMMGNKGFYRCYEMSPEQFTMHVIENWEGRLKEESEHSSHQIYIQQVRKCTEIAIKCVEKDPDKRPDIKDSVYELEELEAKLKEMLRRSRPSKDLIDQTSSILTLDPKTELCFLFEPRKDISTCLKLTNKTDGFIAFHVITNQAKYSTQPTKGIMQPCSKRYISVTLQSQDEAPPNMVCNDTFIVQSAHVSEDLMFTSDVITTDDLLDEGMVDKMMTVLPITYVGADKLPLYSDHSKNLIGQSGSKPLMPLGSKPPLSLQYLTDITNNFSDKQILGKGSFGVVYKGMIRDGEMIAVKKLLREIPSSQEQFENEVNLLMKLEHQNIVRLIGYCYETRHLHTSYQGKSVFAWDTERLLCLEYMPNRSLDEYISDASSGLIWHTRWKVIEGISYGLLYLHEHSNEPIIHLDLKPSNILLDENMCPKITDFGLSRLFPQNQTIHATHASGTFGYMSQEVLKGVITPMADIFSLGVIIMEIITGHKDYPYEIRKYSKGFIELELQKWRNRLQNEPGYTSLETDCLQIERCIQIGLICVNHERAKRPKVKKIIDMLLGVESMDWYISNELSDP